MVICVDWLKSAYVEPLALISNPTFFCLFFPLVRDVGPHNATRNCNMIHINSVPSADSGKHDVVARCVCGHSKGIYCQMLLRLSLEAQLCGLLLELCCLQLQFPLLGPTLANLINGVNTIYPPACAQPKTQSPKRVYSLFAEDTQSFAWRKPHSKPGACDPSTTGK